jgi:hypothetical protein
MFVTQIDNVLDRVLEVGRKFLIGKVEASIIQYRCKIRGDRQGTR